MCSAVFVGPTVGNSRINSNGTLARAICLSVVVNNRERKDNSGINSFDHQSD